MPHLHPDPTDRTAPFLPEDARAALREQASRTPNWQPWLQLLETALTEADRAEWQSVEIRFPESRPVDAPLLDSARITPDGPALDRTVGSLLAAVGAPDADVDPIALLGTGICQDDEGAAALAERAGLPPPLMATVAHFCAMPLLMEAGRRVAAGDPVAVPTGWQPGYCPVCAGWPTLAEARGLERSRFLRCGRCAAGWARELLHCAFCGERDHRCHGALVPADGGELVRVETCDACHGYLKAFTTLRPKPAWALPLEDLRTLPLELRARERGYSRPEHPGWPLQLVLDPPGGPS